MPRRGNVPKRDVLPDPMYGSELVTRLVNNIMLDGKKGVAQKIVYGAFDIVAEKSGKGALEAFEEAMENIMPQLEVKARRVGGATYQVPMEVRPERRRTLGLRWITLYARQRNEKTMKERLANEILDAMNGQGGACNNREDTPINFPLIRYADVLLMLAECYNQTDQQTKAVDLINQVRARVDMPGLNSGPSYLQATTKEQVFERIRHERAVELAGEGLSFSDMKRWGLLETLAGEVKGFTGQFYYNRVVQSRDYLWPIPNNEIQKNPSLKEDQNPGW